MHTRIWIAAAALAGLAATGPVGAAEHAPAHPARLQSRLALPQPPMLLQTDSTLACFEGLLSALLNPACFQTLSPPRPGDCVSASTDFLVQYLFPDVTEAQKIIGFGFLSNDGATVFPSAGMLQLPIDQQGNVRFPTPTELANLQVTQIPTPGDTSVVFVDLEAQNMIVNPGSNTALVVALQFPQGGDLTAIGVGPGIAADADPPDQTCDVFTIDGGTTWFEPCTPGDPVCDPLNQADPLDWGFVVLMHPVVSVESISWSHVKQLYRTP